MKFGRSLAIVLLIATQARSATPEAVDAAIRRGVAFLYKQQTKQGNWERKQEAPPPSPVGAGTDDGQWGGRSALCTYALLAAGERPTEPRITRAVEWLRGAPISGTYALAMRANVWFNLPQTTANVAAMQKDANLLARTRVSNPAAAGLFGYQAGVYNFDLSCSQYGVLGCWAAAQRINAYDTGFWSLTEDAWHNQQNEDGGWSYSGRTVGGSTIQMTAAGVASLLVTQDFAHVNDDSDPKRADAARVAAADIDRGLQWLGKNLIDHLQSPILYALYGIERVGVASGQKYIGDVDWYQASADRLVSLQQPDGSWNTGGWYDAEIDTAFALLILSRGREPVMASKLDYDITAKLSGVTRRADWNLRPRDLANITYWIEQQTERRLNWQIVKLSAASVDDLHDSNIVYMTGKLPVSLKDEEKAKLKQFVEEGGIIIASAEGGDPFFSRTIRTLGEELFPGDKFKAISDNDVEPYARTFAVRVKNKTLKVEGLGNGARLFMLLVPDGDLSAIYQHRDTNRAVAYQFFTNAFLYSIEKTATRFKGQTFIVRPDAQVATGKSLTIARLNYSGQWNPEPGGWPRLAAILRNQSKVNLQVKEIKLGTDSLSGIGVAHLTGTEAVQFDDAQRAALKKYLDDGGLLLIDNCGGNPAFDISIRDELTKIIPDAASQLLSPLPPEHELFHSADGKAIEPQYRPFALPTLGPLAKSFQLRGLTMNGKLAVLYSPQDLSIGLVGQPLDCITGYTPETATALLRRMIELKLAGTF